MRPPPTDLPTAVAELDHTKRVLASKLIELRKFQTERETLLQRIADRDTRIRELEGTTSTAAARAMEERVVALRTELTEAREVAAGIPRLEAEIAALNGKLRRMETTLGERERRINELESELGESLAWAPSPADDLKQIRGIGPKFERALNALGIRTFAQIAEWTETDISEMATKLRVHATRITRDGWVEKAKELAGR